MRIAIASSGLGYILRGIEAWAQDTARALHRAGRQVTLFQGGGASGPEPWRQSLGSRSRLDSSTRAWQRVFARLGGWRYGLGSTYNIEQTAFTVKLWRRIRRDYDIVHVQDPQVALWMDLLHRKSWSRPKAILGHGTEEPQAFLDRLSYLQHLTPWDLETRPTPPGQMAFAVPNFVDTCRFHPGDKAAARQAFDLPPDAWIVLSAAAVKRHHKRVDYLIEEFAQFRAAHRPGALLVVAGARESQTDEVIEHGRRLLGDAVRFLVNSPRDRMPELYRSSDVFALASLYEMMPIALLEALASGLPVACNDTPILRWMAGPAGEPSDLSQPGAMAGQLARLSEPAAASARSAAARSHAEQNFSEPAVVGKMLAMYEAVLASPVVG